MEVGTGLTVLGAAFGSAKVIEKILGPTADYLGDNLKDWTEKKTKNIGRIFRNADRILGDDINTKGQVPPKVLKGVLEHGAFCDDELSAEYFGGVLASSRSNNSRDDRGVSLTSVISQLSTYHIRTHYILYSIANKLLRKKNDYSVGTSQDNIAIFLPMSIYFNAMNFSKNELDISSAILSHSINGLVRERLINNEIYAIGEKKFLTSHYPKFTKQIKTSGILYSPSSFGVELFLWAHGISKSSHNDLISLNIETIDSFKIENGSILLEN